MLSVEEAISSLLASSSTLVDSESIDLIEGAGRVLASDIVAPIFVPPADNSAMDGYVIRHAEWSGPDTALPLSQRITAGSVPDPLQEGTAGRIFTGAEVPEGGDTVVMVAKGRGIRHPRSRKIMQPTPLLGKPVIAQDHRDLRRPA